MKAESKIDYDLYHGIQTGVMKYRYKGILALKCPFDLAIYTQLLYDLKPGTIVEFGSNKGGSALWLADTKDTLGLTDTKIYTLDIEFMHDFVDPRVNFIKCDAGDIRASLSDELIASWKHPLFFIDDASHQFQHSLNILEFFDSVSEVGDYIAVEDGIATIVGLDEQYEGGPHRAIREFMARRGDEFQVDRDLCDYFGQNMTWNIDGYIKRTAKR